MNKQEIKEKIEEGHIYLRAIIEIVGKPKEYVEETVKGHIENIKKETKKYTIITDTFEPPEEQDNYFSAFSEIEFLAKNVDAMIGFCFDYMPSSIEILEPEKMVVKSSDLSGFLNDLQARLHGVNTLVIKSKEESRFYIKNTAVLLRNFVVVLLSSKPMKLSEMKPLIGIKEDDIAKVLNVLINEGKVKKEGDLYKAIPTKK